MPSASTRERRANVTRPRKICRHSFPATFLAPPLAKMMDTIEVGVRELALIMHSRDRSRDLAWSSADVNRSRFRMRLQHSSN